MQKSPFKFLDSYSREDRDLFFGRDKEVEELHSRVFESKILIVYGISGTGKSSLINCGLANKFNDSDWLPISIRRGLNINQSLLDALSGNSLSGTSSEKPGTGRYNNFDIVKVLRSIYLDHFKPIYLIFDQLEELFIFGNKEEKDELIGNIKKVVDSDLQCRFIFSIREEYLAGITEFERIIPSFLANRIRIEKMTRQNAIQVIEGPCQIKKIDVEPGFAEALLEKLTPDNPEVELTYLQVYLDKVLQLASHGQDEVNKLSRDLIDRAGDVKDLLGSFLEEQISQLEDPDLGLVILKSFVSVKGTKRQISEEEVIEYSKTLGKEVDRDRVKNLIQKFIGLRILRDKDQNGRYELRHDTLATKIYEEITLVEKELLEIRQFIENAYINFEKRQLYLTAEDLSYIAPYEDKLFLNEKIIRFISHSKWVIHRTRRRRQNALIVTAVIIISILSFFTIWAFRERGNALEQKHIADEQKNSALRAKEIADSAGLAALNSKNIAVEKEAQALQAQQQSEQARKEAMAEREYALVQKNLAEKLSVTANEQAKIANEERIKAEQERSKAVVAETKAKQLGLLSTAQNLALKSDSYDKLPQVMGLLAVQAYNFNKSNGGQPNDPIIWEALFNAWSTLDHSLHSRFTGSPNEIRTMVFKNDRLLTADLDGQIRSWSNDGISTKTGTLAYKSPISFIRFNSKGDNMITQHDNLDLLLWDIRSIDTKGAIYQELKGHSNLISSVAFSKDEKYMATAGNDSLIIVWEMQVLPASKVKIIKTQSAVKSIIFCNTDSIIYSQENGSVILQNINLNMNQILVNSGPNYYLSLAWNNEKKIVFAGGVSGNLILRDLSKSAESPDVYNPQSAGAGIDLITLNPDLSLLATSSWDRTINLYYCKEYFENRDVVGGVVHLKNLNYRTRSLVFTDNGMLVAALADKTVHFWEISSARLAEMICSLVGRDMTIDEWKFYVGSEIPYEKSCGKNP